MAEDLLSVPLPSAQRTPGARWRRHPSVIIGALLSGALVCVALCSLVYTPFDPNNADPSIRLLGLAEQGHLLGTDALGRDVLSQLMVSVRTSLTVALLGALCGLLLGGAIGLAAASAAGTLLDDALMRLVDLVLAFPVVVLALVMVATTGSGQLPTVVALMVVFTPIFTRVTRAAAMRVHAEDFILAARTYGRSQAFITLRHTIPNISSTLIVQFTIAFAVGILAEASLSYLGVGAQRPSVSFGMMLNDAQQQVGLSSALSLWPGLAIVMSVMGLTLLGDGLRDALDPKSERRS